MKMRLFGTASAAALIGLALTPAAPKSADAALLMFTGSLSPCAEVGPFSPNGNLGADGNVNTPGDAAPCLESDLSDNNNGLLDGGEIPVSPHSGTFSATYDTISKLFSFEFEYTGLTNLTGDPLDNGFLDWHIHVGTEGVNGLVLVAGALLAPPAPDSNPLSDSFIVSAALTSVVGLTVADFETTLIAGGFYINIHSDAYSQGELRSQITFVPEPAMLGLFGLGLLGAGLVKRRKA